MPDWISFLPIEMFRMDEKIFEPKMVFIQIVKVKRGQASMPVDKHILHQQAWKNLSKNEQNPKRSQAQAWNEADWLSDNLPNNVDTIRDLTTKPIVSAQPIG